MRNFGLVILTLSLFLSSCSIQNRYHNRGYHIEQNIFSLNDNNQRGFVTKPKINTQKSNRINQELSSLKFHETKQIANFRSEKKLEIDTSNCGLIVLKDGSEIEADSIEIKETEVQFKKCNTPDSASYQVASENIFMIKYRNGNKVLFRNDSTESSIPIARVEDKSKPKQQNNESGYGVFFILLAIIFCFLYFYSTTPVSAIYLSFAIIFGVLSLKELPNIAFMILFFVILAYILFIR